MNANLLSTRLQAYQSLLEIRRAAAHRNMWITGLVFGLSLAALWLVGMISVIQGREVYLILVIETGLGFGFISTWIRFEVLRGELELLEQIQSAAN